MIRFVQHVFAAFLLIAPGAIATSAQAAAHVSKGGVVTIESAHDVATTIDRLEDAVDGADAKVFARVDHSAGAANVDLEPLRVVAWEDETGKVMLSYTDPATMAARHGIAADHPVVAKMSGALAKLTGKAAGL
jgi:uncharacterized protein (DUF302 family)